MSSKPWPRRAFQLPWRKPSEIDAELEEELQFHLDQRIAELTARGLEPAAARLEALRRFGDMAEAMRYCRAMDRGRAGVEQRRDWIAGWRQDLAFAARHLVRTPAFTCIAVLTLALGIGANTAIFSVVHRLLLDPLPYETGDRMVALLETSEKNGMLMAPQSQIVATWREKSHALEAIEAFEERTVTLTGEGEPERMNAGVIGATLPAFLGITPPLGRGFTAEETVANGPKVVMLGHAFWQRRYAGQREALGSTLMLDGQPYTVVGVMPRDVTLPFMGGGPERQLWLPLPPVPPLERFQAIARLTPGTTPEAATKELSSIEKAFWANQPSPRAMPFTGKALRPQDFMTGNIREILLVLFGVVGVVLLIACANVANLLLARASTRSREFAIRTALGAGRGRLIRQLLTESVCLSLLGGLLGLFLAWRGLDLLLALRPDSLNELDDVRLQPIALAWSMGLALATGLLFGLAPAFFASDRSMHHALKGAPGGAGTQRTPRRMRSALVILEVGMSVTLLVGAGLLIRTIDQMQKVDLGFVPEGLTAVSLILPTDSAKVAGGRLQATMQELLRRVRALPGVEAAGYASGVPPRSGAAFGELQVEGVTLSENEQASIFGLTVIEGNYFDLLQLPFTAGHGYDRDSSSTSMVINEGMAKRFWPELDPIGKRYRLGDSGPWTTVIGVVKDVKIPGRTGEFGSLQTYPLLDKDSEREQLQLVLRTRGELGPILKSVQREIESSSEIKVTDVNTVSSMLDEVLAGPRFSMVLFVAFAGLALALATIGLYGVISYSVSQRTREIGVRIALGAGGMSVLRLVVGQGMRLTLAGIGLGLLGAVAGTRAMKSLLYQVNPLDPPTFVLVTLVLVAVAALASYLPARRATLVDPVVALKSE